MAKVVAFPDLKERFTGLGLDAASSGPDEFGAYVASEIKKYGKIAKDAGIKPRSARSSRAGTPGNSSRK